jgi:hypothetical protein
MYFVRLLPHLYCAFVFSGFAVGSGANFIAVISLQVDILKLKFKCGNRVNQFLDSSFSTPTLFKLGDKRDEHHDPFRGVVCNLPCSCPSSKIFIVRA